jgi:hypothetical protein
MLCLSEASHATAVADCSASALIRCCCMHAGEHSDTAPPALSRGTTGDYDLPLPLGFSAATVAAVAARAVNGAHGVHGVNGASSSYAGSHGGLAIHIGSDDQERTDEELSHLSDELLLVAPGTGAAHSGHDKAPQAHHYLHHFDEFTNNDIVTQV